MNAKAELTELETQRSGTGVGEIKESHKSIALWNESPSEAAGPVKQAGVAGEVRAQLSYVFGQPDQVC